jgi:hypothetical protein
MVWTFPLGQPVTPELMVVWAHESHTSFLAWLETEAPIPQKPGSAPLQAPAVLVIVTVMMTVSPGV